MLSRVHEHPGNFHIYLFMQMHCAQLRDLPATPIPYDDITPMMLLNSFTLIMVPELRIRSCRLRVGIIFFSFLSFFHLAEEEELLQKWLSRTHCSDESLGNSTRLGTGVIFLTPSPHCFGLMSIPHSICSGHVRIKQGTCFPPCSVCSNKWRMKPGFQVTSDPFTAAFAELGCHLHPS